MQPGTFLRYVTWYWCRNTLFKPAVNDIINNLSEIWCHVKSICLPGGFIRSQPFSSDVFLTKSLGQGNLAIGKVILKIWALNLHPPGVSFCLAPVHELATGNDYDSLAVPPWTVALAKENNKGLGLAYFAFALGAGFSIKSRRKSIPKKQRDLAPSNI